MDRWGSSVWGVVKVTDRLGILCRVLALINAVHLVLILYVLICGYSLYQRPPCWPITLFLNLILITKCDLPRCHTHRFPQTAFSVRKQWNCVRLFNNFMTKCLLSTSWLKHVLINIRLWCRVELFKRLLQLMLLFTSQEVEHCLFDFETVRFDGFVVHFVKH